MPRARSQEVLQKSSYAQATIEWTWSNGESLLLLFLLARCTGGNGDPAVAHSNLPCKTETNNAS